MTSRHSPRAGALEPAEAPARRAAEPLRIAAEQAALRRVATLVARGASQAELFSAVSEEIAHIVGADITSLMRLEDDDTITLVAAWSAVGRSFPIGLRRPLDSTLRSVRDAASTTRSRAGEVPPLAQFIGAGAEEVRASVGVPIMVDGRVWGIAGAVTARESAFPPDTERRMAAFTELVATAVANAEAREHLGRLAEEQAALRRVAELVARGEVQEHVFAAVAGEASRLLGDETTCLLRLEGDGEATIVAVCRSPTPVGSRAPHHDQGLIAMVEATGRPARVDDYTGMPAEATAREHGVGAAVAVPISVEGRLWGVLTAVRAQGALPAGAEERLGQFSDITAAAIVSAERKAQLLASRARVIESADAARRRLQRDVHDGAQQRLVHTIIALQLARAAVERDDADVRQAASLIDEALAHAERATAELRDVVHGILPMSLARGGLRAAVESLAAGLPLRVDVSIPSDRLPSGLETTAYFIVAEALTNVVKHAAATTADVSASVDSQALELVVRDDGRGGADESKGTGLAGLADRVAAADGRLELTSPPGRGTTLRAVLPRADRA